MGNLKEYAGSISTNTLVEIIQYNVRNAANKVQGILFLSQLRDSMKVLEYLPSPDIELPSLPHDQMPASARLVSQAQFLKQLLGLSSLGLMFTYVPLERIVAEHYWRESPERISREEQAKLSPDGVPMPPLE